MQVFAKNEMATLQRVHSPFGHNRTIVMHAQYIALIFRGLEGGMDAELWRHYLARLETVRSALSLAFCDTALKAIIDRHNPRAWSARTRVQHNWLRRFRAWNELIPLVYKFTGGSAVGERANEGNFKRFARHMKAFNELHYAQHRPADNASECACLKFMDYNVWDLSDCMGSIMEFIARLWFDVDIYGHIECEFSTLLCVCFLFTRCHGLRGLAVIAYIITMFPASFLNQMNGAEAKIYTICYEGLQQIPFLMRTGTSLGDFELTRQYFISFRSSTSRLSAASLSEDY